MSLTIESDLYGSTGKVFLVIDDNQLRFPFDSLIEAHDERIQLEDTLRRLRTFSRMAGKTDDYSDADAVRAARSLGAPVLSPNVMDVVNALADAA